MDTTKKYNYWCKRFIETKVLDEHDFITQIFPLNFSNSFQKIIDTINRYQPNLIIVDGCTTNIKLDVDKNDESVAFLSSLFSYLHEVHSLKSLSVIITIKQEDKFVENYFKKLPIEIWKLNRPAYLNKDCPERGDTQLFVQNNSI
jgi:alpha-L-fucosidase